MTPNPSPPALRDPGTAFAGAARFQGVAFGAGWRGYGAVLYMALLATMVAYGLWYTLIRRYPMSLVMPFTLLAPVIGVASGIVLLGEALSWRILLGGAATVAGVALIVLSRPQLVEPEAEAGGGP